MSANAAVTAFVALWCAGWCAYAAVQVGRSLRPSGTRVACNRAGSGYGSTVCISTVCPSLAAFCVCSKDGNGALSYPGESAPTDDRRPRPTSVS